MSEKVGGCLGVWGQKQALKIGGGEEGEEAAAGSPGKGVALPSHARLMLAFSFSFYRSNFLL